MPKSHRPTHHLCLFWMGQKFQTCLMTKGIPQAMQKRVKNSRTFDFGDKYVIVYAIGYPCEPHRMAAIAQSYNSAPNIMIDSIDY